jgi:hypothetical protein
MIQSSRSALAVAKGFGWLQRRLLNRQNFAFNAFKTVGPSFSQQDALPTIFLHVLKRQMVALGKLLQGDNVYV